MCNAKSPQRHCMKQNIGEIDGTVEDIRDGNRKEGSKSLWRCGVLSAATYVP